MDLKQVFPHDVVSLLHFLPSFLIWFYKMPAFLQTYVFCFPREQSALGISRLDQSFFPEQEASCPGKSTMLSVLCMSPCMPSTPGAHYHLVRQYILTLSVCECVCVHAHASLVASVVSNSQWPHGPAWLLCPWDFPSKDTEWVTISSSRGSSRPRDWTSDSCVSCIAGGLFIAKPPGKALLRLKLARAFIWLWGLTIGIEWCVSWP